jgi:hypothetical protein
MPDPLLYEGAAAVLVELLAGADAALLVGLVALERSLLTSTVSRAPV